jgi:hypothetical protein
VRKTCQRSASESEQEQDDKFGKPEVALKAETVRRNRSDRERV